jgi:chitinase
MKAAAAATLVRGLALALVLGQSVGAVAAPSERPGAEPPPSVLFSGRFMDFERTSGKVVGAYVPSWESTALVDKLPGHAVTHLLYAFLRMCGPGQLPKDAPRCEGRGDHELAASAIDQHFDEAFQRLKARAPHVKVLASVGGWGGSDPFFHFANDAAGRERFAASVAGFLRTHRGFDGVDIDWEHPTNNGSANGIALGSPADGRGYAELMHTLRRTLDRLSAETGRPYLVTSAINPAAALVEKIDYRDAARSLDLVFMMNYDFYGPWTPAAGHHAALRSGNEKGDDSVAAGLRNMLKAGVPKDKLVVGVAMYGRGFTGVAPPAAGARFNGAAREGVYAGADGSLTYREIAARYLDRSGNPRPGWRLVDEPELGAWALWNPTDRLYMGYDDPRAVWRKGRFALEEGLAGVFAWEISQDNGDLLNAMNLGLGHVPVRP